MSIDSDETIPYALSDGDSTNDSSNSLDHPNYTTKSGRIVKILEHLKTSQFNYVGTLLMYIS